MSRPAWAAYHAAIWEARFSAHLHARCFAVSSRLLGWVSGTLQGVALIGSVSAFVALARDNGEYFTLWATLVVVAAAGILQLTGLPGRVQRASSLREAWAVRCSFWDDAVTLILDSKYLGPLAELQAPEAALHRISTLR